MSDVAKGTSFNGNMSGRRALVTGAANGIGRAIADGLHSEGADVVGIDVEKFSLAGVEVQVFDLSKAAAIAGLVARLEGDGGPFDILVNVAGCFEAGPCLNFDIESYRRVLAINLDAPILLMKACIPAMIARGYGRVVNVTSVHAFISEPEAMSYDVSKAGLTAATRTFGIEVAAKGVLVNALAPGFVRTRMSVVDGIDELESPAFERVYLDAGKLPIGRASEPPEIAAAALWLASEQNSYMAAQTLVVDGGLCAVL